jgi:hypothetical protein
MPRAPLPTKQMIAFKIGARARKFVLEDCLVEGYELLYTALAEAELTDPELHALLQIELTKFEQRVADLEKETMEEGIPSHGAE